MKPLRIAFLWHLHQPDYRLNSEFSALPWVRLHAIKDYLDIPNLLSANPAVRHTFNITPSLVEQLHDISHGANDPVRQLCAIPAPSLSPQDKARAASILSVLHAPTMVAPFPRLAELLQGIKEGATTDFTANDWSDLQVWYLLAWVGPCAIRQSPFAELVEKETGFTDEDMEVLLQAVDNLVGQVIPSWQKLAADGSASFSVTPYAHPILPLLLKKVGGDFAQFHISAAQDIARSLFPGGQVSGMWPAEGGVDMDSVTLMAKNGVQWTATGEEILSNTLGDEYLPTLKWFPWRLKTDEGQITMFFRDRELSDAIGFEYQRWQPADAAADFVRRLETRRSHIVLEHGEEALNHAVVSIVLDGENCWEYYSGNGEEFIKELIAAIASAAHLRTVTFDQVEEASFTPPLTTLASGSWINGTFDIWHGTPVKNLGWELLADIADKYRNSNLTSEPEFLKGMAAAQSSDWFWWYEDRHHAPNKYDFDVLFRNRLKTLYEAIGAEPPVDLDESLYVHAARQTNGIARAIPVQYPMSTMHYGGIIARDVSLHEHHGQPALSIGLERLPGEDEELEVVVGDGNEARFVIDGRGIRLEGSVAYYERTRATTFVISLAGHSGPHRIKVRERSSRRELGPWSIELA